MNQAEQQRLRYLAELMVHTSDLNQLALAQGTLELLDYTDRLTEALLRTTEMCCEAIYVAYEHGPNTISDSYGTRYLEKCCLEKRKPEDRAAA
jgi:hypothetical protein